MAFDPCNLEITDRDYAKLAPWFAEKLRHTIELCHNAGYQIAMLEGYRSPDRQDYLYSKGRSLPGKKITYARGWESFHQYSVAADIALYDGRVWSWDAPWDEIHKIFHAQGFETLEFEASHVQITGGMRWQEAYKISRAQGMLGLWSVIQQRSLF